MAKIVVCSAAEIDYTESLKWYAERSVKAADDFETEFGVSLQQIVSSPERFPSCDGRHRYFLLRRFPFRIIYRALGDEIIVIAVAHSSRPIDYWAER